MEIAKHYQEASEMMLFISAFCCSDSTKKHLKELAELYKTMAQEEEKIEL